jgi:hypothetical protein
MVRAESARESRVRVAGLRVYEAVVLADFAVVVWLIRQRARIGLDLPHALRELPAFALYASGFLLGGLVLRSLFAGRRSIRRAWIRLRAAFRPRSLADFARFLVILSLTSWAYSWLKVMLPLLRPDVLFDAGLFRLETALHLGVNPGRLLQGLFPYAALWKALDGWYAAFIFTVMAGLGWFATVLSRRERARFLAGFSLLWVLGSWGYYAVPSLGPCYVLKDDYVEVRASMPMQSGVMDLLFAHYGRVRALHRHPEGTDISPYLGVAAMPSLHVAAHAFLAFFARRRSRPLFIVFSVATVLTLFTAVASGWHYAIDGYAGLVLAWACALFGERFGLSA